MPITYTNSYLLKLSFSGGDSDETKKVAQKSRNAAIQFFTQRGWTHDGQNQQYTIAADVNDQNTALFQQQVQEYTMQNNCSEVQLHAMYTVYNLKIE